MTISSTFVEINSTTINTRIVIIKITSVNCNVGTVTFGTALKEYSTTINGCIVVPKDTVGNVTSGTGPHHSTTMTTISHITK